MQSGMSMMLKTLGVDADVIERTAKGMGDKILEADAKITMMNETLLRIEAMLLDQSITLSIIAAQTMPQGAAGETPQLTRNLIMEVQSGDYN